MTKILVIEDDPAVRALIFKLLSAEGFEVISGTNGQTGLQLAQEQEPDLILCDIMMPECNGYEVLEQLRHNPVTAGIPFIFLSARSDKTDLRQGMELGADDYLTKPFKRAELLGAISARLAKQATITQPYINEMKRAAQSLNQLAYLDPLTNLPNRILLHHKLQEVLEQIDRSREGLQSAASTHSVAIICLCLDEKATEVSWSYVDRDRLLPLVAERLIQAATRESTVARLEGAEFCVLLTDAADLQEVIRCAEAILEALAKPYILDSLCCVHLQPFLGIVLCSGQGPDTLISQASTAMRYAKLRGTPYQIYTHEVGKMVAERQLIQSRLGWAIERHELRLLYQPQANIVTGRIIAAEALLHWCDPDLGVVSPDKFIPVADEMGLSASIGEWVLQNACIQAGAWQMLSPLPIRVSVNLSTRQFKHQALTTTVARILRETGLDPNLLVLELTEASLMENAPANAAVLKTLRSMGVHISIDDFGTGYSSLNCLKRLPIDTLKIDRSFVQKLSTSSDDAAIVKAIITLAQSLQFKVIAEGVETQEQFTFLHQHGCYALQGYLFSRPVIAEEFEQMLMADTRLQPFPTD